MRKIELEVQVDGIDKVNKQISSLETQLESMKEELKGVSAASPHFQSLTKSISDTEKELKDLTQTVSQAAEEQITLNQQIGEGEDKLMLMAQAGDTSSAAYKKLVAEVGNMKRIQMETNFQIDNAAKGMTGRLLVGIQRLSTAYQVGMAATQMFGVESEKAQEIMVRLQAVMSFTQGLDQLKQLTVGMNLFGKQGVLALNGIKKGIIATGIGALVVAVGLLVAYWDDIMELTLGISSELNDQLDTQKESVKAKERELKAVQANENVLRLQGKTEREILELKMAATEAVIEEQKLVINFQKQKADLEIKAYERNQQIAEDIIRGVLQLNSLVLKALVAPIELLIKAANEISDLLGFGELTTFSIIDSIDEMIEKSSKWASTMLFDPEKKRKESEKEIRAEEEKLVELENQYAAFQLQIQQLDKESSDKAIELARATREKMLEIIEGRLEKEKQLEDEKRKAEIDALTGFEREIALIREEGFIAQREILEESSKGELEALNKRFIEGKIKEEEYRKARQEILVNAESKLTQTEKELFDLRRREMEKKEADVLTKAKADAEAFLNEIILTNDGKEMAALDKKYEERKTKLEALLKSNLITEKQYSDALIKLTEERNAVIEKKDKETKEKQLKTTVDSITQLGSVLNQFASGFNSGLTQIFSSLTKGVEGFMTLTKDGIKKDLKSVSELASSIVSATTGAIGGLFSILSEERNRNLEEDLSRATKIYNDELKTLDTMLKNGQLTEEQYNRLKFESDKKKFNEEEKLRKNAFDADKGMRIGQAIMAGAQGAIAAFAGAMALGPILGPIVGGSLAALVTALTGVQVAIISGQEYRGAEAPSAPTAAGMGGGVGGVNIAPTPTGSTLFGQAFGGNEGGSTQMPGAQQSGEMVVRAYILEADVTNTQNLISTLEQRAEIS